MTAFDSRTLAHDIEELTAAEIDALPYGVIRLDDEGRVLFYSKAEGRLSGYGRRPALGRLFFEEIAPCMNTAEFQGRIATARALGQIDIEFGWFGDFDDPERHIRVRIVSATQTSATQGGGYWMALSRE